MNLSMCIKAGDETLREGYMIGFDYDEQIVEDLKRLIPHTERSYYPASKQWWISIAYEGVLNNLFGNFEAFIYLQGKLL